MKAKKRHPATDRQKRRSPLRVDGEIREFIELLALRGWRAPAIRMELLKNFRKARTPTLRTIQRWVNKITPEDESGPWRLADDPEDAALVLSVMTSVRYEEVRLPLTKDEARWIVRIRKAAPDIPAIMVLPLAWAYMGWQHQGGPTELLDLLLAARPWRSFEARQALDKRLAGFGAWGGKAKDVLAQTEQIELWGRLRESADQHQVEYKDHAVQGLVEAASRGRESLARFVQSAPPVFQAASELMQREGLFDEGTHSQARKQVERRPGRRKEREREA